MTRISKDGVVYRVSNAEGTANSIPEFISFDRGMFPKDDDFSMDFMGQDLGRDAPKGMLKKQENFRDLLSLKLEIK